MDFKSLEKSFTPFVLGGIALGIVFKYIYDYYLTYSRSEEKSKVKFDIKGFLLTVLLSGFLSILLYSGLLSEVDDLKDDVLILSVATQTGFFWQTIIGGFRPAITSE